MHLSNNRSKLNYYWLKMNTLYLEKVIFEEGVNHSWRDFFTEVSAMSARFGAKATENPRIIEALLYYIISFYCNTILRLAQLTHWKFISGNSVFRGYYDLLGYSPGFYPITSLHHCYLWPWMHVPSRYLLEAKRISEDSSSCETAIVHFCVVNFLYGFHKDLVKT